MRDNEDGYIALLSVLIVGAITTAIGLTLLLSGINSQQSALVSQQSIQARQLATACADEALQRVHDNTLYAGSGSLTLGAGGCTFSVTNPGSNVTITTSGTVNNVVKKLTVYATINSTNVTITSWQEVI